MKRIDRCADDTTEPLQSLILRLHSIIIRAPERIGLNIRSAGRSEDLLNKMKHVEKQLFIEERFAARDVNLLCPQADPPQLGEIPARMIRRHKAALGGSGTRLAVPAFRGTPVRKKQARTPQKALM